MCSPAGPLAGGDGACCAHIGGYGVRKVESETRSFCPTPSDLVSVVAGRAWVFSHLWRGVRVRSAHILAQTAEVCATRGSICHCPTRGPDYPWVASG